MQWAPLVVVEPPMHLVHLLRANPSSLDTVRAHLDGLSAAKRVAEVLELGRRSQAHLFELAKGFRR